MYLRAVTYEKQFCHWHAPRLLRTVCTNHEARSEIALKKTLYLFLKKNSNKQTATTRRKKVLYPTAINFAEVESLDLQSELELLWEHHAAAPAAVSSCQNCSSKTRCFSHVQQDSVSYSVFHIFHGSVQMKWNPKGCALAGEAQPRDA